MSNVLSVPAWLATLISEGVVGDLLRTHVHALVSRTPRSQSTLSGHGGRHEGRAGLARCVSSIKHRISFSSTKQ